MPEYMSFLFWLPGWNFDLGTVPALPQHPSVRYLSCDNYRPQQHYAYKIVRETPTCDATPSVSMSTTAPNRLPTFVVIFHSPFLNHLQSPGFHRYRGQCTSGFPPLSSFIPLHCYLPSFISPRSYFITSLTFILLFLANRKRLFSLLQVATKKALYVTRSVAVSLSHF